MVTKTLYTGGVYMKGLNQFFYYYSATTVKDGVKNFSTTHLTWLSLTIIFIIGSTIIYKNLNTSSKATILKNCGILVIVLYFIRVLWAMLIGKFSPNSMLPFHLCGIMIFIEFLAVFTDKRFFKELSYCAGMPGAALALFTPELGGYPLFCFQYQVFIVSHVLLIIIPLYMIVGNDFVPNKQYVKRVFSFLCILAAIDAVINSFLHGNYMFISKAPANTPFIIVQQKFGYSGYVIFLVASAYFVLNIMYIPWKNTFKKKMLSSIKE
jgi:hypothetical integral membrane protein (TIGR02206 family)